ncbi:MAG: prepilin-type N-terminal cleavage/methylation domain-containing protein [Candidatus Zambryskibacteria bacterium]|nr:prepilin-type N-terminal cleavage/methylation domain-containing protein [Candidatus Zambryskibacteria bacterium]
MFFKNLKLKIAYPVKLQRSGGFTLIELLVSISIAMIIITVFVMQQRQWDEQLAVNTEAYELALMIRQAQIYSLGVKGQLGVAGDIFNVGYGIYMRQGLSDKYIFYADKNHNEKYDAGEEIETTKFDKGITIKDVCGSVKNWCFEGGGSLFQADIRFFRPDTAAKILLTNVGGIDKDFPPVKITLQSAGGSKTSLITVDASGQVSVQ